jgi:hypothetical protein
MCEKIVSVSDDTRERPVHELERPLAFMQLATSGNGMLIR